MTSGLPVFDTTIQETNAWLAAVEHRLPPCDRQQAYAAARAALHTLRDRLPEHGVLALSAQLPMLLRGVYLEGWRGGPPDAPRDLQPFLDRIADRLPPAYPRDAKGVAEAVFAVIADRVDAREARKLVSLLPEELRPLWPPILWVP